MHACTRHPAPARGAQQTGPRGSVPAPLTPATPGPSSIRAHAPRYSRLWPSLLSLALRLSLCCALPLLSLSPAFASQTAARLKNRGLSMAFNSWVAMREQGLFLRKVARRAMNRDLNKGWNAWFDFLDSLDAEMRELEEVVVPKNREREPSPARGRAAPKPVRGRDKLGTYYRSGRTGKKCYYTPGNYDGRAHAHDEAIRASGYD